MKVPIGHWSLGVTFEQDIKTSAGAAWRRSVRPWAGWAARRKKGVREKGQHRPQGNNNLPLRRAPEVLLPRVGRPVGSMQQAAPPLTH